MLGANAFDVIWCLQMVARAYDAAANVATSAHREHDIDVCALPTNHSWKTAASDVSTIHHSKVLREMIRHGAW
jgi:hypothetical protein